MHFGSPEIECIKGSLWSRNKRGRPKHWIWRSGLSCQGLHKIVCSGVDRLECVEGGGLISEPEFCFLCFMREIGR